MRTTVVVVTWRGAGHLGACLAGLAGQDHPHRTLVVDNASTDGSGDIARSAGVEVVRPERNLGYAGAIAAVLDRVDTEFVAWLNDDAVPDPSWLGRLEDALDAAPGAGAASARLVRADGSTQSVGVGVDALGRGFDLTGGPVFGFCGGAALLRVGALRAVGGVPADFFCYYEDTDTSWRLRLHGWDVVSVPGATAVHAHGATSRLGSREFHRWNERNRLVMLLRCAPTPVALKEVARFAAITAKVVFRRPEGANFLPSLRLRVLGEVLRRAPRALVGRAGDRAARRRVWRERAPG
ncbi:glycosyltransferase family 2 protein [Actinokineospora sp. PR83]|uniref:glycosyltransferase family 2 protein n=1 Tax=Actinokineospora sp. PR83 TaxID=2884908 RepID=UPI0027E070F5|nr:glycosyltransferase family 2 protein [Actinokineospora sp. PR83]MCG8917845.1 glycosyltransferase family 2 protein [Actinokineospora sp. PR83]